MIQVIPHPRCGAYWEGEQCERMHSHAAYHQLDATSMSAEVRWSEKPAVDSKPASPWPIWVRP